MSTDIDYNEVVGQWDEVHHYSPAPRHRRRLIFDLIKKLSFNSCLDVGCAQPYLLEALSKGDKQLFGCDISEKVMIDNRTKFSKATFEVVDISKDTFPGNKTFDLVVSSEVLEHIDDWRSAVKNLSLMTKKYLLITVPGGKYRTMDRIIGHFRHFKVNELSQEVEKNGLKVTLTRRWGFPFHTFYQFAINAVAPEKMYESFGCGKLTFSKRVIYSILYALFFINDLFPTGNQIILLAEKTNNS